MSESVLPEVCLEKGGLREVGEVRVIWIEEGDGEAVGKKGLGRRGFDDAPGQLGLVVPVKGGLVVVVSVVVVEGGGKEQEVADVDECGFEGTEVGLRGVLEVGEQGVQSWECEGQQECDLLVDQLAEGGVLAPVLPQLPLLLHLLPQLAVHHDHPLKNQRLFQQHPPAARREVPQD